MTAARRMWELGEPVHDVVYFSPEPPAAATALGLRGFWMGYFAFRAAPLGPVEAATVTALFHGFPPSQVERALPDAWQYTTPELALAARQESAATALRRICGATLDDAEPIADLAWRAAQHADDAGRTLGAVNRALPRPDDPVAALWQALTTLREHRGDGHIAALVAAGVGPVEAHLLKAAAGSGLTLLQTTRRWPDDAWERGRDALVERGWLQADGGLTESGRRERDEVERRTDAAAEGPWTSLGAADTERLAVLLAPLTAAVHASGELPAGNPTGVPSAQRTG